MPFDANGNFSLVPGTIVADGMNVLPSQHNPPFQDVANGLSQAVVRDGRAPMTGPLNMNGNKITGVASGSQPTDVVTFADISDLGVAIGDGKWSLRDLSPNWLRRNGGIYEIADYPVLAAMLPALPDGVVWANQTLPGAVKVNKIVPGGGQFVAFCDGGKIFASSDGSEWEEKTSGTAQNLIDGAYGNGVWCGVAANRTTCISGDANTWSLGSISTITSSGGVSCVAFKNGLFLIGGEDIVSAIARSVIVTSEDATSWSSNKLTGYYGSIQAFGHNGSIFLAGGSGANIFNSTDADTWTRVDVGASVGTQDIGNDGSLFVLVGSGGIFTTTNGTTVVQRSSQGATAVDYSDGVGWLAVGGAGSARISANGTSWTVSATGTALDLLTVCHDPGSPYRYLVGGASGLVLEGLRTQPTQFRVPNDDPTYGWVRAL